MIHYVQVCVRHMFNVLLIRHGPATSWAWTGSNWPCNSWELPIAGCWAEEINDEVFQDFQHGFPKSRKPLENGWHHVASNDNFFVWFAEQLRKAREVHPDKQRSSSESTSSFHEVSAAYEALTGWNAMKCSGLQEFATTHEWQGLSGRNWPTQKLTKILNRRLILSLQVWSSLNAQMKYFEIFNYQYLNQVASSKFPQALLGAFNAAPEHPRKRQSKSADFALLSLLSDHVRLLVCAVVVLFQLARHSEMWRASKFLQPVPLLFHVSLDRKCQVQDLFRRVAAA